MPISKKLLLVEDDNVFRNTLSRSIEKRGISVVQASGVAQAKVIISDENEIDYAVLDLKMPDGVGTELIDSLVSKFPKSRVIILTGFGSIVGAVQAVKQGAVDYLSKPIDTDRLLAVLENRKADTNLSVPSLDKVEWEHLQRVLAESAGNITKAAKLLGIERRSLQRKLQKYAPKK